MKLGLLLSGMILVTSNAFAVSEVALQCVGKEAAVIASLKNVADITVPALQAKGPAAVGVKLQGTGKVQGVNSALNQDSVVTGSYQLYPAGTFYKKYENEIVEVYGVKGKDSFAYKTFVTREGERVEILLINKKPVEATCALTVN